MHLPILRSAVLPALAALGIPAATAQSEFPYAAGTDSTGRAQAVSDAAGRVMIESPEFPRGLWVDLVGEAGQALADIQVEYQGRPDSLAAVRCVDPSGQRQETLLWIRPGGDSLPLALESSEPADLPEGLVSIDWRIDLRVEALLEESSRLIGWEAVDAFLRERWQDQTGRVIVKLDDRATVVDLDRVEAIETLVTHLQKTHQPVTSSAADPPFFTVLVNESSSMLLRDEVIFQTTLFASKALETAVRQALRRPQGRITRQAVASMTQFQAAGDNIHSLEGLEHFAALEWLQLHSNHIEDVSPLAALTNLRKLLLNNNQVSDVSPLAVLTKLTSLELRNNSISDVSPLAALINLTALDLRENQIADVRSLGSLTNLEWVYLDDNQIDVLVALTPLADLQNLRLQANSISDVSPLAALTNLESKVLSYNEVADVRPLAVLTKMGYLELRKNQISDASPLAGLTRLKRLDLSRNEITDARPLAALTNLNWLGLSDNTITDARPLAALTQLSRLFLSGNKIADVSPLVGLTRLHELNLWDNEISDIGSLVANTGLGDGDKVQLGRNPLSDNALNEQIPALKARGVSVGY